MSRRRTIGIATLVSLVALVGAGVGTALWWNAGESAVSPTLATRWPTTWSMRARWEKSHPKAPVSYCPVAIGGVAPEFIAAVLAGEDAGYFGHGPFDFDAIHEALTQFANGRALRGASTLTQQVAKNLYLSPRRTLERKVQEARLAYWLEQGLGKRRVLALYLNLVELGPGIFGVEAAAQHYFGTSAAALSRSQAVDLAASIPSPRRDNPTTQTRTWSRRRAIIDARLERFPQLLERVTRRLP